MTSSTQQAPALVEHFFRHEYGKLVAVLANRVGVHNVEAAEDAAQFALAKALENWVATVPDNPTAWLFRVAHNHLIGALRQQTGRQRIVAGIAGAASTSGASPEDPTLLAREIPDDLLRMLFVCCDEAIPVESQLVLALKILCGFSIKEVAQRLFLTEASTYKRLERARTRLRENSVGPNTLEPHHSAVRVPSLHNVLYVLFTEGYLSSHSELAIREELCAEAIRLTFILAQHPIGQNAETFALMALMHLHAARLCARQGADGSLLLLEEQDRSLWDQRRIQLGLGWLTRSADGDHFSRYHAEAAIAAEHCLAPSFDKTNWEKIVDSYNMLEGMSPSPLHRLNRAVAVAEWQGPAAGLEVIDGFEPPTWLAGSYLWAAVLADLNGRCGNTEVAKRHRQAALGAAPSTAVRESLARRLGHVAQE